MSALKLIQATKTIFIKDFCSFQLLSTISCNLICHFQGIGSSKFLENDILLLKLVGKNEQQNYRNGV